MPVAKDRGDGLACCFSPYIDLPELLEAIDTAIESHRLKKLPKLSKENTSKSPCPVGVLTDGDFENWLSTSSSLRASSSSCYRELILATSGVLLSSLVFSASGSRLFDELCTRIDVNSRYANLLPQWSDVALQLGVDELQRQWVYSAVRPRESFTRAMLELYMGNQGTLGQVLQALYDLECFEILERLSPSVRCFLRDSCRVTPSSKPYSDFFSTLATVMKAFDTTNDPCSNMRLLVSPLCKRASEVSGLSSTTTVHHSSLHLDPKTHLFATHEDLMDNEDRIEEALFGSSFDLNKHYDIDLFQLDKKTGADSHISPCKQKVCRVLLLFSSDGVREAEEFYHQLQGHVHKGVRMELFRLTESRLWYPLLSSPEACCQKWIHEVDYVVPVLTPNFLSDIYNGNSDSGDCGLVPTSPLINRYIYTLLRARFTEDKCINHRVRPVIPQFCLQQVSQCSAVKREPLFRLVWVATNSNQLMARMEAMMVKCGQSTCLN